MTNRRLRWLTPLMVLALAFALAACGDDNGDDPIDDNGVEDVDPEPVSEEPDDPAAAEAEIAAAYNTFFDNRDLENEDIDAKLDALEDGEQFRDFFTQMAQADPEQRRGTWAEVDSVEFTSATHADVVFTLSQDENPVLPSFPGEAVLQDGRWKVAAATYCDLLALQGVPCPADNGAPADGGDEPAADPDEEPAE